MTTKPAVSILMGVYNGHPSHITEAIESILVQDWQDFEFIIVNDGSRPDIRCLLENYAASDRRITLINNPVNLGLTRSLNIALHRARGVWIARMDADDICLQGRLSKQLQFLSQNPGIAVLGGRFKELVDGKLIAQRLPLIQGPANIRKRIIWFNPLCHSSVIAKRQDVLKFGGYDESFKHAQDYDLWLRMAKSCLLDNIDEPLVIRRMEDGISIHQEQSQRKNALKARWHALLRGDYTYLALAPLLWFSVALLIGPRGQALYRKLNFKVTHDGKNDPGPGLRHEESGRGHRP